jgi:hypothetical protein
MIHGTLPLLLCFPNYRSATFSAANPGNPNTSILLYFYKRSCDLRPFIFNLRVIFYLVNMHHSAFIKDLIYIFSKILPLYQGFSKAVFHG